MAQITTLYFSPLTHSTNNNSLLWLWVASAFCMAGSSNWQDLYIHMHPLPTRAS